MSTTFLRSALWAVCGFTLCGVAQAADGFNFCRDAMRRNFYPEPFVTWDRAAARAPFCTMVNNGWEVQNLLSDAYFDRESNQLNQAGKIKVQTILLDAPDQHRIVYVRRTLQSDTTAARMVAVKNYINDAAPEHTSVPVLASSRTAPSWPADRVDRIGRRFLSSMPDPKLPEPQGQSEGK